MKKLLLTYMLFLSATVSSVLADDTTTSISEEYPLDATSLITNPSFENSTNGWEVGSLATQTNNDFKMKAGGTYLEKWTSSGNSVGSAYVYQTLSGLPDGIYKLTAGAMNFSQNNTSKKNTGVYIYAGNQETPVYTPADYSVSFTSIDGEIEIGFVATNATGNWIAVDNFRLYQTGELSIDEILAELSLIIKNIEERENPNAIIMSSASAQNLSEAIAAAKQVTAETSAEERHAIIKNLKAADAAALASMAEHERLYNKIAEVISSAGDYEGKEGSTALKAELDKANALVQNAEATSAELAAEVTALDKAMLAFNLANATAGTGLAPKVTFQNNYVATGSTEALVRATMTAGNMLERGICWSTNHAPTVLDERTTEYHSLKGNIYHIRGLQPATVYYIRPYVMNKTYTVAYGEEIKIVTHPKGTCTGSWDEKAPDAAANKRCREAIQQTIAYFNEWTGIMGFHLSGHYGADTQTADCSYGGWMRIGPNAGNQAIGTVLHETGHGVGVGTQERWRYPGPARESSYWNNNYNETQGGGKWLGREANEVLRFLENNYNEEQVYFTGDGIHGWGWGANNGANISYDWLVNGADKDKHTEIQYIGGMCILHGLFIDGLCPTSSYPNGIPGYSYNFDDSKKYYLMNKNENMGLGQGVLYQRTNTGLGWQPNLTSEALSDSAAWYIEFQPTTGYYFFKNAATGRYISHSSGITAKTVKTVTNNERFQLMPDRTNVTIGEGSQAIFTHGYWFTWYDNGNKSMCSNAIGRGYGSITVGDFSYYDTATNQQWIIISEDELEAYQAAAVSTGISKISVDDTSLDGTKTVVGIYTLGGMPLKETQKGFNIIKYSNGTSKKIYVK